MPKDLSKKDTGTFKSKVLVRDLRKNKSYVVNAKLQGHQPDRLRLDVTSPLGQHLFTLVSRGDQVEYIVVKEKKYVRTSADANALKEILPVPINPQRLLNVFFESPIQDKNWSCTEKSGQLQSCKELGSNLTIRWEKQPDGRRRVEIEYPKVTNIQINIYEYEEGYSDKKNLFELPVPKNFRVIQKK